MNVDYLIVGQGISGTVLSWNLLQRGKKIIVFDNQQQYSASRIASGLINPVSGIRLVKVNQYEIYLPYCEQTYTAIGAQVNAAIMHECSILNFHENKQERDIFREKSLKLKQYLHEIPDESRWTHDFNFKEGISRIAPCQLVNMQALLSKWSAYLTQNNLLINETFDWQSCDITAEGIHYKGITASKIICCDGIDGRNNPFFSYLPFTKNKGEVLMAHIPRLERDYIYRHDGIAIVPWQHDLFWIGASFDRDYADAAPSIAFREQTMHKLDNWLRLPYSIIDHWAALRPATIDRMPFAGGHDTYNSVTIFNGMGTKGCLFAPYYAHCFAEYMINGTPLPAEIDINRFKKI